MLKALVSFIQLVTQGELFIYRFIYTSSDELESSSFAVKQSMPAGVPQEESDPFLMYAVKLSFHWVSPHN